MTDRVTSFRSVDRRSSALAAMLVGAVVLVVGFGSGLGVVASKRYSASSAVGAPTAPPGIAAAPTTSDGVAHPAGHAAAGFSSATAGAALRGPGDRAPNRASRRPPRRPSRPPPRPPWCAWSPPRPTVVAPLAGGATWHTVADCPTAAGRVHLEEDATVSGSARVTVGAQPIDSWVIERHTVLHTSSGTLTVVTESQSSELYAPILGLVVYQVEQTVTPRSDGTMSQTRSTSELLSATPEVA